MRIMAEGKGLELKIDYEGDFMRTIISDPQRIRQILINLVGNALKFTLKGGITLKTRIFGADIIEISVIDTGVGIK